MISSRSRICYGLFSIKIEPEMISKIRKTRQTFTPTQKLEYAKLMVEESCIHRQVMDLSGAGATAASRWKQQFLAEQDRVGVPVRL